MAQVKCVPVTIISGFLGAGKSTLLNSILSDSNHGLRIVVVENEFGDEVSIENTIVTSNLDKSLIPEFVALPNGCLCCTIRDELVDSLSRLIQLPAEKPIDHILIECSGLADPGPVAALFWVDEDLDMKLRLDGVVTLVDGKNALLKGGQSMSRAPDVIKDGSLPDSESNFTSSEQEVFVKQIALADVILINKIDLIKQDSKLFQIEQLIQSINPTAKRYRSTYGKISLDSILKKDSYYIPKVGLEFANSTHRQNPTATRTTSQAHSGGGSLPVARDDFASHVHDTNPVQSVTTCTLRFSRVFDQARLDYALGELFWENEYEAADAHSPPQEEADADSNRMSVWRMKGIVNIEGSNEKHIYQGVHDLFEGEPCGKWMEPEENRESIFIFIGWNIDESKLKKLLESACK